MQMPKGNTSISNPRIYHLRKPSKTNIQEKPPTLLKKLELLHSGHTQYRCGKSPIKVLSTTKQTTTNKDKEIEDQILRNQIKLLKQNRRQNDTQENP